jgi:hypothetical protein
MMEHKSVLIVEDDGILAVHLRHMLKYACQTAAPERGKGDASPVLSPQTTREAKAEWRNEGNPN